MESHGVHHSDIADPIRELVFDLACSDCLYGAKNSDQNIKHAVTIKSKATDSG